MSKERQKNSVSTHHENSIERASIQLDKFYNPVKGYDQSDAMMITPRSFNHVGNNSGKLGI